MLLLAISLLAGLLTVLAPCTISLLPVIVGGTLSGGSSTRRVVVVTLSLGVSVIAFTLLLKASTALINVPQTFWQGLSGVIIIALGIAMIFPRLWDAIPFLNSLNKESNKALAVGYQKQNIAGDILTGAALGPVFSSCSPTYFLILATVLPRSIPEGIIYLLAYSIGLCGGLFVVALAGQKLLAWLGVASDPNGWLKRVVGVLFLALGLAIFFGYDKVAEAWATEHFFDVTTIEQKLLAAQATPAPMPPPQTPIATTSDAMTATSTGVAPIAPAKVSASDAARAATKALSFPKAPEITKPSGFVNTGGTPITIGQFKGKKIVLIDFWTYSCINCQRTLPYMKAWDDKYRDLGLEIIGIHTPEFAFEHLQSNVETAVKGFGLKYPSILDNDYGTWNAFGNSYWPRKYLIDIDGYIVYDHAGEGNYDDTERAIQKALQERADVLGTGQKIPTDLVNPKAQTAQAGSPETYFGSSRNEYLANGNPFMSGTQSLTIPQDISLNKLYLGGVWNFSPEFAQASEGARIQFHYAAKAVYFVASSEVGATVHVFIDGTPIPANMSGDDVLDATATIHGNRLYKIVEDRVPAVHTLEIRVDKGTLDAYTFTFG
jgi:cytochrome c biogenesis protein CcdA/thiol-disulfide isomerase/thioredoxin